MVQIPEEMAKQSSNWGVSHVACCTGTTHPGGTHKAPHSTQLGRQNGRRKSHSLYLKH